MTTRQNDPNLSILSCLSCLATPWETLMKALALPLVNFASQKTEQPVVPTVLPFLCTLHLASLLHSRLPGGLLLYL